MEINKEELCIWIAALRSGNYKQAIGTLQNKNGFCCLGIACKVLIPEDKRKVKDGGSLYGTYPDQQPSAPDWLKNIDNNFQLRTGTSLAKLNDEFGYSFTQIADALEKIYLSDGK